MGCEINKTALKGLERIYFDDNPNIGDTHMKYLIAKLQDVECKIKVLGLSNTGISDITCQELARKLWVVEANKRLQLVDLSNNDLITDKGIESLHKGLQHVLNLVELQIVMFKKQRKGEYDKRIIF